MKQKFQIIISASAASFLAFTAFAQETSSPKTYEPGFTRQIMTQARVDRLNDAVKASDIIGMTVNNYQGENVGKVEDIAVDLESGRIVQVILSTGAFSGMDGTMTAVPPQALHHDADNKILQLDVTKEKINMAPTFEPETWDEGTQSNRVAKLYVYYDEHPYFISSQNNNWITNTDGTLTRTLLHNESLTNKADETDITRNVDQTPHTWSEMGNVQKASSLMDMRVNNLHNENLGTVDNLLVDLPTGRIVAVIISSSGFLGMGDELSPVPPTALRFNEEKDMLNRINASPDTTVNLTRTFDQNRNQAANSSAASPDTGTSTRSRGNQAVLLLDASKKMLRNAPHFKADQWPDFGQPSYSGGIYRAYNVEPYFDTNTIAGPNKITSAK